MRLGKQEVLAIDGIAQFGKAAVAKLRQQHDAVGIQLLDLPRAAGDQQVGPAIRRLLRSEADLPLLELLTQQLRIEHLQLGRHHLYQQALQAQQHRALFLFAVQVPVHHFMMKALATAAHQVAVDRGTEADTGGLDALTGHDK
ncbi:hypothetical protein D9M71_483580 [compost metagenome]